MIYLIPLTGIDINLIKDVKFYVEEVYEEKVRVESSVNFPEGCFNKLRNQYNAECVIEKLPYKEGVAIYITEKDLYVEGLNFVFGLAESLYGKKGIVSIARLKESFYRKKENYNLLLLRTVKEIIHEIGHLKGLSHCSDPKCVMHFSNSLYDTDYKDYKLCEKCRKKLRK